MAGLEDFIDDDDGGGEEQVLHVMDIEYTEQFGDPIVHLWCRDEDGERTWVEVEGHHPSFYIHENAFSKRIVNHDWVRGADDGYTSIQGQDLVRIETKLPWHVGGKQNSKGLREYFDQTWEADVFFTSRFLIDTGIKTHVRVDMDDTYSEQHHDGDYRVHVEDIEPADVDWRATPRMVTIDIEVLSPDGFPEPDDAEQPVTAITAHDTRTDAYTVWVLRYEGWAYDDTEVENIAIEERPEGCTVDEVRVFEEESQMLHDFNRFVEDRNPDLLSGWNSSTTDNGYPFDYPYLINRCKARNVMSYRDWSPMGEVWDGNWGPRAKGVSFFDMLKGYKKTQWQKPKGGYGLENTANRELDYGKEDIDDIDDAWRSDIGTFLKYNIRDVAAVVGIDREVGVIDLFQNIRAITGAQFDNCHNNIDLLDVFILRYAHEMDMALPTNEEPSRGWYYGAHVFEPKLGRHENVVYPDVWSMYPNAIRNVNMSPETLIGTQNDLDDSEYTEDDCRWTYVDTRRTDLKKESDPRYEKLYFLKPSIQEGFMTQVVDDLMGMKDAYDGTPLYDAVKRIVNSVYGVYGDSDSYGKGYRLFDWRIAEGITLAGRKMIQDSSERFVDAANAIKDEHGIEGRNAYRVGGDTDSVMTAIPFMDVDHSREGTTTVDCKEDGEIEVVSESRDCPDGVSDSVEVPAYYAEYAEVVGVANEAAERVNDWYDEWAADTFNLTEGRHYCELEIESFAPRAFVPKGITKEKAKKRYAEIIAWEEGEWFSPPEFSVTGIDIVRSDRAVVTREVLQEVLEDILRIEDREAARQAAYEDIKTEVAAIEAGNRPNAHIARPKGMSSHPDEYGSLDKTPMPTYRGAKYANQNFDWERLGEGSKPQLLYIERVRGDWPTTYTAETKEDGDEVDAIAVEHPNEVPEQFVVDTDKMVEKVLEDPLTPILEAMQWSFDDAVADTEQTSVASFM